MSKNQSVVDKQNKRIDAYFKSITGDSTVGFSLGYTSYIYFNKKGEDYIYLHHMLD